MPLDTPTETPADGRRWTTQRPRAHVGIIGVRPPTATTGGRRAAGRRTRPPAPEAGVPYGLSRRRAPGISWQRQEVRPGDPWRVGNRMQAAAAVRRQWQGGRALV